MLPETEPFFTAGLGAAHAPGRMEIREGPVPFIFDGAHTPASVRVLVRGLEELFPEFERTGVLVFGAVKGKDIEGMACILGPRFREIIISTPGSFKPSDPAMVHAAFEPYNARVRLIPKPEAALEYARGKAETAGGPVCVTGSFYMVAEILKLVG
jgi:dihydrofolate synthase/folylpolyglutamate synthase